MNETRYTSVAEMAAGLLEDSTVQGEVNAHVAARRLVNRLVCERARRGLSQGEVAARMGVSVSKVSRLEDVQDDDLRLGDLRKYVQALGMNVSMLLSDDKLPAADRIKHCVFQIEDLLKQLTELARQYNDDKSIVDGILRFRGEVLFNFVMKYEQSGLDLPIFSTCPQQEEASVPAERAPARRSVKALA